jgi:hypothetical protein
MTWKTAYLELAHGEARLRVIWDRTGDQESPESGGEETGAQRFAIPTNPLRLCFVVQTTEYLLRYTRPLFAIGAPLVP